MNKAKFKEIICIVFLWLLAIAMVYIVYIKAKILLITNN